jgi:hypothetical protein
MVLIFLSHYFSPDLDGGFLDFVKQKFNITSEGKSIPVVDILITTQNWSQFVETWDFQNIDKNVDHLLSQ